MLSKGTSNTKMSKFLDGSKGSSGRWSAVDDVMGLSKAEILVANEAHSH